MATYDVLIFQEEAFREEVKRICDEALDKAVEICKSDSSFQGESSRIISNSASGKEVEVESGTLKAWVLEYGAGKYMDTSNPYLGEYLYSGLTARGRPIPNVARRGKGPHMSLNVETGELVTQQGGDPEGMKLPDWWAEEHGINQKAQPFMQKLLEKCFQTFVEIFDSRYNSIDIDRFYIIQSVTI